MGGLVEQSIVAMGEQRPREEGLAQSAWEVFHLEAHWSWFAILAHKRYLRISQHFCGLF